MLDSGAEVTVVDAAFAEATGIKARGNVDVRGTGGSTNLPIANDVIVTIGTMSLRTGTVLLMDLTLIAKMIDHPVDVILGKEVLNQTVTDLNFQARTITFHDPLAFVAPSNMTRLPLTVADGIRSVPVRVEGHEVVNADFDLGNGGALLLYPARVAKWGLLNERPRGYRLGGGVGGMHQENLFIAKTVTIAGFTLHNVPTQSAVEAAGLALAATETVQGNIGMPIWSRFHLLLDFSRNQIFLSADAESLARPFAKNRSGITAIREGDALKVLFVDPSFPHAVCESGAEIVTLDGVPVAGLRSTTEWAERPAGTVVKLSFRDGRQAELTLADYY